MNRLLKQLGFSTVEVIVSVGLLAGVTVGVMKLSEVAQKQTINANQNIEIDGYMKTLRHSLRTVAGCDAIVGTNPSTIDLSSIDFELPSNVKVIGTETVMPDANGVVEVLPISVFVKFRKVVNGQDRDIMKKTYAHGQFNIGKSFKGCADFDIESIKSAYKISCETVGGIFKDAVQGNYSCDFQSMNRQGDFVVASVKHICEYVFKGSYSNGVCDSIDIEDGTVTTSNINSTSIDLSGNKRTTFTQDCTSGGSNNFVRSVSTDGNVSCAKVTFCTKGIDCDGDSGAPVVVVPPVVIPPVVTPPATCSKADFYSIIGDNSDATATKVCRQTSYDSTDETCATTTTSDGAQAGVCEQFKSGACTGSTVARLSDVVDMADGSVCGTDKTCQSGVCVNNTAPPLCYKWSYISSNSQCFTAGTQVTMASGERKNIEDIVKGDIVLDGDGKESRVKASMKFKHHGKKYSINGGGYFVTEAHPFKSTTGWKAFNPKVANVVTPNLNITQLQIGDILLKEDEIIIVESIDWILNSEPVYNIEVSGTHEFIADRFVVHNKKHCPGGKTEQSRINDTSCTTENATTTDILCEGGFPRVNQYKCLGTVNCGASTALKWGAGVEIYATPMFYTNCPGEAYTRATSDGYSSVISEYPKNVGSVCSTAGETHRSPGLEYAGGRCKFRVFEQTCE